MAGPPHGFLQGPTVGQVIGAWNLRQQTGVLPPASRAGRWIIQTPTPLIRPSRHLRIDTWSNFGHSREVSTRDQAVTKQENLRRMAASVHPPAPISLFYSYSHTDEALRKKLETHLSLLKDQGVIQDWHDRRIQAGTEWDGVISENLEQARTILLLVSSDFLASRYCRDVEVKRAMERHEAGTARVVPVILRPVDWHTASFGKLAALPRDGKPVTTWKNRDEAFTEIARGIREVANSLAAGAPNPPNPAARPSTSVSAPPAAKRTSLLDRTSVVRTVTGLSPGDLAAVVTFIEGAAAQVGRHGTVSEQAADLIRWAESSNGPGLEAIQRALENFR